MIRIGIDDTDVLGSPGTNQLARAIARDLAAGTDLVRITRHQLLDDPRVPCTSQNGSASILLVPRSHVSLREVVDVCRARMASWYVEGSDPGLCVTDHVPGELVEWGQRCKSELVGHEMAFDLGRRLGIHLEGLGGTNGGVIGALAAIGLAETGSDGGIVMWRSWPDDLSGEVPVSIIRQRDMDVIELASGRELSEGTVAVGKHLRPNLRNGRVTVWVDVVDHDTRQWKALKLK